MKIISYRNSDEGLYQQTLVLRDEILRQPFGVSIYDEDLSYETGNFFFGALDEGRLIGTVNYFQKTPKVAQLCAFAVTPKRQRAGIGSLLVTQLLEDLRVKNFEKCVVEAHDTAVDFYKKNGFCVTSGPIKNEKLGADDYMMEFVLS